MTMLPFGLRTAPLSSLAQFAELFGASPKMPVLFVGHGSPMNAIEENVFVKGFRETAASLPRPRAILCISAHWETRGTFVTAMERPRTIYDFGGFPPELYEVVYPAPGSPSLATETKRLINSVTVGEDLHWGLDHGAWTVLRHFFPDAAVPVVQLSLDMRQPAEYHYELARALAPLRDKGVLIVGSGNMVHNLRLVAWNKLNEAGFGFDWALEAQQRMKTMLLKNDHKGLINYAKQGEAFRLAIPTPEHFLPLLYVLAVQNENDKMTFFNDQAVAGSLTMTSLLLSQS